MLIYSPLNTVEIKTYFDRTKNTGKAYYVNRNALTSPEMTSTQAIYLMLLNVHWRRIYQAMK